MAEIRTDARRRAASTGRTPRLDDVVVEEDSAPAESAEGEAAPRPTCPFVFCPICMAFAAVEEAKLPASFRAAHAAANLIVRCDTASIHADLFAQKADLYRPAIRSFIETGLLIPGESYVRSLRIRRQFRRELLQLLERYDVLLTPTTPAPAPEGMATGDPQFQVPWSLSGFPSITVPCGLAASGLFLGKPLPMDASGPNYSLRAPVFSIVFAFGTKHGGNATRS